MNKTRELVQDCYRIIGNQNMGMIKTEFYTIILVGFLFYLQTVSGNMINFGIRRAFLKLFIDNIIVFQIFNYFLITLTNMTKLLFVYGIVATGQMYMTKQVAKNRKVKFNDILILFKSFKNITRFIVINVVFSLAITFLFTIFYIIFNLILNINYNLLQTFIVIVSYITVKVSYVTLVSEEGSFNEMVDLIIESITYHKKELVRIFIYGTVIGYIISLFISNLIIVLIIDMFITALAAQIYINTINKNHNHKYQVNKTDDISRTDQQYLKKLSMPIYKYLNAGKKVYVYEVDDKKDIYIIEKSKEKHIILNSEYIEKLNSEIILFIDWIIKDEIVTEYKNSKSISILIERLKKIYGEEYTQYIDWLWIISLDLISEDEMLLNKEFILERIILNV